MSEKILLIDGNSIINRAFFAIPVLTNRDGEFTNGIYGFMNIIFKLIDEEKPDYMAVAFDLPAPTFRHAKFEAYKGNRKGMPDELRPQLPLLKNLLRKMNVKIYEAEGYEADDVLGTLAVKADGMGLNTVVVSGDRDLLQLCTDTVKVRIPKTKAGRTEIEDYLGRDVHEKIGVTPREFIDVKALMGDASDNIPGVPGIGEKTALKIIQQYGSLEAAIENAAGLAPKKASENLLAFKEQAVLSKELATICLAAPVEVDLAGASVGSMFNEAALEEVKRLDFKTFIPRFARVAEPQTPKEGARRLETPEETREYLERCAASGLAAFLFEYSKEGLMGVSFCADGCEAAFAAIGDNMGEEALFAAIAPFMHSHVKKITHGGKKNARYARRFGVEIKNLVFDTMLAAYILDASRDEYPCESAAQALRDYAEMNETLESFGQRELYYNVEHPLAEVLLSMETHGIRVDRQALGAFGHDLSGALDALTEDIYNLSGEPFNINSPAQLGVVLFEKLGLKSGKKTKTGWSTAADVLEKLADKHEIVPKVLEYRTLAKLKSTYVDGLLAQIDPGTGKIHTTFQQTVASTGRLSSIEPNLQNIPVRLPLGRQLRKVFVPESEEFVFLDGDYSQIELRVLAHMAGDETLIGAFRNGQDIHRLTASQVFGVPYEHVTGRQRAGAKAVNFGIVYGIGSFSLSEDLHISRKEAQSYIDGYFAKYPKVKEYLDASVSGARRDGYAQTIFGRRRAIPELVSKNANVRAFGERVAMNMPVQGTAADIIKIAMINVYRSLRDGGFKSRVILQVHDELLLETAVNELEDVKALLKREMEGCVSLAVPLEVDCHVGANWYEAK